jgi:hypothetical protein
VTIIGKTGLLIFRQPQQTTFNISKNDFRSHSKSYAIEELFLQTGDSVQPAVSLKGKTPPEYFIHIDFLKRISFYSDHNDSLTGDFDKRLEITKERVSPIALSPTNTIAPLEAQIIKWVLHLNHSSLDQLQVESKLGNGALQLCTGGGQVNFYSHLSDSINPFSQIELLTRTLSSITDIEAHLYLFKSEHSQIGYKFKMKATCYALNAQEMPLIEGSLNFATNSPINLAVL